MSNDPHADLIYRWDLHGDQPQGMANLGIQIVDIGLPGAGPHVVEHVTALAKEIRDAKLPIEPHCAARTLKVDIEPVVKISQEVGIPICVDVFIGSSPIREYAEDWTVDKMFEHSEKAIRYAKENDLMVMYVTEDTTRALPSTVERLYSMALDHGCEHVTVCDTVGHATPDGTRALIGFVKEIIKKSGKQSKLNWHGHRDRGLDVAVALAAAEAGADVIHATALGIGERAGNCPMDLLLVNMKLLGWIDNDLTALPAYVEKVAKATGVPFPTNYPVLGEDAFETGTGVHAAAVIKAFKKDDLWLANRVYSGVPADMVGREQKIAVGPMSGKSNVVFVLERRGVEPTEELVDKVFAAAKASKRNLTDAEIDALLPA
ncbi:MAG: LeuA family protein [Planctomycetota bacterium]|jgi:2-isopropylmalate synthase